MVSVFFDCGVVQQISCRKKVVLEEFNFILVLVVTSATLVVTGALLVVTRSY